MAFGTNVIVYGENCVLRKVFDSAEISRFADDFGGPFLVGQIRLKLKSTQMAHFCIIMKVASVCPKINKRCAFVTNQPKAFFV